MPSPVEVAATDLALALDPVRFAGRCGIVPDPWQADVLRSNARQLLLLCSRQAGKSTVVSILALHRALYWPGSLVLIVAPSLRQSSELFRKVLTGYHAIGATTPAAAETRLTLELANGSRLVALPGSGNTIRGYSAVDLLILDEAALVSDEDYGAVRPMLAVSKGRLVALSTPKGRRGWFHAEWTSERAGWHRVTVTAEQVPRIDPAWLAMERERIGMRLFRQEYLCGFVDTDDAAFDGDAIAAALDPTALPLFPGRIFP